MKITAVTLIQFCLALGSLNFAQARTWKDASGKFEIEAEMVSANSKNVILKKSDGKQLTIPLSKLSQADRDYVAEASKRGTHPASSSDRSSAVGSALKFLSKNKLPRPRNSSGFPLPPDDAVVRASVEGLALLAVGDASDHRGQIETCRAFIDRHIDRRVRPGDNETKVTTRALSYAVMFATEHALKFPSKQNRLLAQQLAETLLRRQVSGGGWADSGDPAPIKADADGTAFALVALAGASKLGNLEGAEKAGQSGLEYLKSCASDKNKGEVTQKPDGDLRDDANDRRSMVAANSLSLNGSAGTDEYREIFERLKKDGNGMVTQRYGTEIRDIEGEAFMALMFHRESEEASANYWKIRLAPIRKEQRPSGAFPDPTIRGSGPTITINGILDQKGMAEAEEAEFEKHLPGTLETTAFRALTLLVPEGRLDVFETAEP